MLAYFDSLQGMVPCRLSNDQDCDEGDVRLEVTATRGIWRRGNVVVHSKSHVFPRASVRFRKFGTYIVGPSIT